MFNFFRRKKSTETTPIDEASVIETIDNTPSEADATLADADKKTRLAEIQKAAKQVVDEALGG